MKNQKAVTSQKKHPFLDKTQLIVEAEMQTEALKRLSIWLRNVIIISSIGVVFSIWGMAGTGERMVFGIVGILLTAICVILAVIINLGIHNGNQNVERILNAAGESK